MKKCSHDTLLPIADSDSKKCKDCKKILMPINR